MKSQILSCVFHYFKSDFINNRAAQNYLQALGLDINFLQEKGIEFGFNTGQFYMDKSLPYTQEDYLKSGLIIDSKDSYKVFGGQGIIFPLRDGKNNIVNLYAIKPNIKETIDVYLNKRGLFPYYPKPSSTSLFITDSIIPACLFLQKSTEETGAIICLDDYHITSDVQSTIQRLPDLKKIILIQGSDSELYQEAIDNFQKVFPHLQLEVQ